MTDMPYPIINVKTSDGLILHGLLTEPVKPAKTIDIHIHGAGGNFYGNSYFEGLTNRGLVINRKPGWRFAPARRCSYHCGSQLLQREETTLWYPKTHCLSR